MNNRFQVPSILLGLFLRKLEVSDTKNLTETLPWRLPEFDAPPQFNTQGNQQLPPDAPRVRFTSKDGRLLLELAPAKLQLRMIPGKLEKGENNQMNLTLSDFEEAFKAFIPMATRVHSVFNEHYGLVANRAGVLTEFIGVLGQSANQRMQEEFFGGKMHFGERIHEMNIAALAKTVLVDGSERQVNRWTRLNTMRSNDASAPVPDGALQVQIDINTLPEDTYDFTAAEFEKFLNGVHSHIATKVDVLSNDNLFAKAGA